MFRTILIWLGLIPDPRPVVLSPEGKAMIARLDEIVLFPVLVTR